MAARRKWSPLVVEPDEELRERILQTTGGEPDRGELEKDLHLLEAAMASDRVIVSLDGTARELLAAAAQQVGEIGQVMWVSPENDVAAVIAWLQRDAPAEAIYMLG